MTSRSMDNNASQRTYTSLACCNCRDQHRKCDGQYPCNRCRGRQLECFYSITKPRGGFRVKLLKNKPATPTEEPTASKLNNNNIFIFFTHLG